MYVINNASFGQMRKAGTVCRADSIYRTLIVFRIDKLARLFFILPVFILLIIYKPFLFEFGGCYLKMRRNTFDIGSTSSTLRAAGSFW